MTAQWWSLFKSPELDALVKAAISGNQDLASAEFRLAEAKEGLYEARSALQPQVGLDANVERAKQSASAFGLQPSAFPLPPNYNLFQVGPTASYTLDLFGGVRRRVEETKALALRQQYQLDAAYMTLTGRTVAEAIQIAALRAEIKVAEEVVALDQEDLDLVKTERRVGSAPDSDVVIAASQLAADETAKPELEQALSQAEHALAVLVGRPAGAWAPPAFDINALALPVALPLSVPSSLVRQRPDILAAEEQLHADSARIGIATANLYPNITLSAGLTLSSLDGSNLFASSGLVWSTAAGLVAPVFDGGMRQAERRAALDAFKASAADYQQTVLTSFGQVADLLTALAHDAERLHAQQNALQSSAESVRLQRINYTRGGIGLLYLVDAQRTYEQALRGFVVAEGQRYQDTVQLLVAMGGGWWGADLPMAGPAPRPSPAPLAQAGSAAP